MILVLDTNALVQIFGARSPFRPLQQAILNGRVTLAFSRFFAVFGGMAAPEDRFSAVLVAHLL